MSMLEVYCETVRDLLGQRDPKEGGLPKLEIRMLAEGVRASDPNYSIRMCSGTVSCPIRRRMTFTNIKS